MASRRDDAYEDPNCTCEYAPKGRNFPEPVKRQLRTDVERMYGEVLCPVCLWWDVSPFCYQFHHIRLWSEGGESTWENGILTCPGCHTLSHLGIVTPFELDRYKHEIQPRVAIRDDAFIQELVDRTSPYERLISGECVDVFLEAQDKLIKLRNCAPQTKALRREVQRTIARVQLHMAGALTSMLSSVGTPKNKLERYFISVLARHAARVGEKFGDLFLEFQARHSLATNAVAIGDTKGALTSAQKAHRFFEWVEKREKAYAGYFARNVGVIYEQGGRGCVADKLIDKAHRLSETAEDGAETLARHGQLMMLRGEMRAGKKYLDDREDLLGQSLLLAPIQRVIETRLRAGYFCLTGNVSESLDCLEKARLLAQRNSLGHQQAKIALAISLLSSKRYVKRLPQYREGRIRDPLPKEIVQCLF